MKWWYLSLSLLLIVPLQVTRAQNPDSLITALRSSKEGLPRLAAFQGLFEYYVNNDPEKAREYATQQLAYAELLEDEVGLGQANYNFGVLFNNKNEFDSAAYLYKIALEHFEKADNLAKITNVKYGLAILDYYKGEYDLALDLLQECIQLLSSAPPNTMKEEIEAEFRGKIHTLIGYIHFRQGNLNIAMDHILQAVRTFEKINNQVGLADAYNSLGGLESTLGNYEKSIEYISLALRIYEDRNDKIYEAQALNDIGLNYYHLRKFTEAESILIRSAELSHQLQSINLEATAYTNLGKTYNAQKRFDQAVKVLSRGLTLAEQTETPIKVVEIYVVLGQSYRELQDYEKAIFYFNRAVQLAGETGLPEALSEAYLNRSVSYERTGDIDRALQDFKKHAALNDSIFDDNKSRQIEELRTVFELETKEKEIQIQQKSIQLLEQEAQISQLQKSLLGLGLISLVFLLGFGGYAFRQKMKKTELARQKMDAELQFKTRELTTQALHLAKKNETLENLKHMATRLGETGSPTGYHQLIQSISSDLRDDKGWDTFVRFFEDVHPDFFNKAAQLFPGLSPNDYRLLALIRMNLSSKEMANILRISLPGIKKARQRLRRKLGLDTKDSLEEAVLHL